MGTRFWTASEDRYGGVVIDVIASSGVVPIDRFEAALREAVHRWLVDGKRGLWLKVRTKSAGYVAAGAGAGFDFHHAQRGYVMMAQWLLGTDDKMPLYAFTKVGVGGIVLNRKGEVLMVQERVASPKHQASLSHLFSHLCSHLRSHLFPPDVTPPRSHTHQPRDSHAPFHMSRFFLESFFWIASFWILFGFLLIFDEQGLMEASWRSRGPRRVLRRCGHPRAA